MLYDHIAAELHWTYTADSKGGKVLDNQLNASNKDLRDNFPSMTDITLSLIMVISYMLHYSASSARTQPRSDGDLTHLAV